MVIHVSIQFNSIHPILAMQTNKIQPPPPPSKPASKQPRSNHNRQSQSPKRTTRLHAAGTHAHRTTRHRRRDTRVDEPRAALHVDELRGAGIRATNGLRAIRRRRVKNRHGILQTGATRRLAATREAVIQRQVVDIAVGGRTGVGDGVGEAVGAAARVFETRGLVEGLVGGEGSEDLRDDGVLRFVVRGAVAGCGEVDGEGAEVVGAGLEGGGAGEVERLRDAGDGLFGLEEGL